MTGYRVATDGWHTVRVSDYLEGGSLRHFYRLTIGEIPVITRRYPLGLKAGTKRPFEVRGFNLGKTSTATPEPFGLLEGKVMDVGALAVTGDKGEAANTLPVAIGRFDELEESTTEQHAGRGDGPQSSYYGERADRPRCLRNLPSRLLPLCREERTTADSGNSRLQAGIARWTR